MKKSYHTIGKQGKVNEQELAGFLAKNGQFLMPMVDLIEQCRLACDELIDVTGRAAIEAVLQLSASQAAGGPAQQGKRRAGDVVFYGRQPGQVMLSDRKLEVQRPRLRRRLSLDHASTQEKRQLLLVERDFFRLRPEVFAPKLG